MKPTHAVAAVAVSLIASHLSLAQTPEALRLTGLVNLGALKQAILERTDISEPWRRFLSLGEGQREGNVEVVAIQLDQGAAEIRLNGTSQVRLRMAGEVLSGAHGIALENAGLEPVLRIYSQLAERTLLRAPHLGSVTFSLRAPAGDAAAGARVLNRALSEKGITTIPDGTKFVLVVPAAMATKVRPRSTELAPVASTSANSSTNATDELPPGIINFPSTDVSQVMVIYAEMVGRKLDRGELMTLRTQPVELLTQNRLTKAEVLYALDRVLEFRGIKMSPVGEDKIKPVPVAQQ